VGLGLPKGEGAKLFNSLPESSAESAESKFEKVRPKVGATAHLILINFFKE
jgi:hypothetical protein